MSGFQNFIMRGNLVQLAVPVVIGTQFSDLVKQFVQSFINPLLSLAGGQAQLREPGLPRRPRDLHLRRVPDRRPVVPDLLPGGLLRPGAAGDQADPAVRAQPRGDPAGLPGVHDEHPDGGTALPRVLRGSSAAAKPSAGSPARTSTAPAGPCTCGHRLSLERARRRTGKLQLRLPIPLRAPAPGVRSWPGFCRRAGPGSGPDRAGRPAHHPASSAHHVCPRLWAKAVRCRS